MAEAMRQAFEAWAKGPEFGMKSCSLAPADHEVCPGEYLDYDTQCAWLAWQAATAAERDANANLLEGLADEIELRLKSMSGFQKQYEDQGISSTRMRELRSAAAAIRNRKEPA